MKIFKILLIASVSAFLAVSCTQKAEKEMAIEAAKKQLEADVTLDAEAYMKAKHPLFKTYIFYLVSSAEFEVEDITDVDAETKMIQVKVLATPKKNRLVLADIAAKQDEEYKAKRFNLGSAINLIEQQPGMVSGQEESRQMVRLRRDGSSWKAEVITAP